MVSKIKSNIKQRFSKALKSYDQQAIVQRQINRHLLATLLPYQHHFQAVLEIGCGTGDLSQQLQQHCLAKQWVLNDLCEVQTALEQRNLPQSYQFLCGDAEKLDFSIYAPAYDLIASASAIQWFEQPDIFLDRCRRWLLPQGLLLLSTFTQENLNEIKQLTQVGLNYPSLEQWQTWLKPDFKLIYFQSRSILLPFSSPLAVLKHLKQSGVTATHAKPWTKGQLADFCQQYQTRFPFVTNAEADSLSQVRLTYTPLFILAQYQGE